MRRYLSALLIPLLLAGCGSSGGRETTPTTRPQDVRAAVARAQLAVADLGGDWKLTAVEPAATTDKIDQSLEQCVGKDLDIIEQADAESGSRTFERGSDTAQQQIVSSSAAFGSESRVARLFAVFGGRRFAKCMATAFQARVQAQAGAQKGLSLEAAAPVVVRPAVAGADQSVHITDPVKVHLDQLTLDGRFDIVLLATRRVVSMLLGFSVGPPIPTPQLVHLTQLLLDRQRA